MQKITTLSFLLSLFLVACGGEQAPAVTEPVVEEVPAVAPIALEVMPETTSFPAASIDKVMYKGGKFTYTTSGYEFGTQTPDAGQLMCANSDKGQHIHLIVDNGPYSAQYTPEFEYAIEDGEHYVLSFLSRSYHQSIKNPAAGKAMMVNVANGAFTKTQDVTNPMLFYSRPKGAYRGKNETEKVMLDFYPVNAPEGTYQVKAEINGEEFMLMDYKPRYITGLPLGENTVTLTLLDSLGAVVATPLNPVSRTFTLEELPTGE